MMSDLSIGRGSYYLLIYMQGLQSFIYQLQIYFAHTIHGNGIIYLHENHKKSTIHVDKYTISHGWFG